MEVVYRLVVSDIDGTLIDKNLGLINGNTVKLVKEYQKLGGHFSLATGRMDKTVISIVEELGIDCPIITYNGSKIVNVCTNEVIYESKLDIIIAKTALQLAKKYMLDTIVYLDNNAYKCSTTKSIKQYEEKENIQCREVDDLVVLLETAPTKILFLGEEDNFYNFISEVRFETNTNVNFVQSEPTYLELLGENTSKGNALVKLANYLNISLTDTIAIGDERNDIPMLKIAGLSVAVCNAKEELKEVASYVSNLESSYAVNEILAKAIKSIGG